MFVRLGLNQNAPTLFCEVNCLSHRKAVLGAVVVSVCFVAVAVIVTFAPVLESINPVAALTAVTVAVVGMVWFKKTSH